MRTFRIPSARILGIEGRPGSIDVAVLPGDDVVLTARGIGARDAMVRVHAALRASGFRLPNGRYVLDRTSGGLEVGDPHLDLPTAIAVLAAGGEVGPGARERYLLAGELGLDGSLRPIRGAILAADAAKALGLAGVVVPRANGAEAVAIDGLDVRSAETLVEVTRFLRGEADLPVAVPGGDAVAGGPVPDLSDVRGQEHVKRALEVAAAGAHNLLLVGAPRAGKTTLALRLPGILPPLPANEALATTRIYSVAGKLPQDVGLIRDPPFRQPHSTISDAGMIGGGIGGGKMLRPGEVSLAHNGVLFLDHIAEFRRGVIEKLRDPLEEQQVRFSRAGGTLEFPAAFMLIAAMTPCPCGFLGDTHRSCTCTPREAHEYLARVSGPLLDRIDMHVEVPLVRYADLVDRRAGEPSATIRGRVIRAREVQRARFADRVDVQVNARMTARDMRAHCAVDAGGDALLRTAFTGLGLSARAYHRVLKIARTIADLGGERDITSAHVSEAIQYRSLDRAPARRTLEP